MSCVVCGKSVTWAHPGVTHPDGRGLHNTCLISVVDFILPSSKGRELAAVEISKKKRGK